MSNDAKTEPLIEVPGEPEPAPAPLREEEMPEWVTEVRVYHDAKGRKITERIPVHGSLPAHLARFTGHAQLQLKSKMGVGRAEVEFPIPTATDPIQAFRLMQSAFERVEPEIRRQAQGGQDQIVIANSKPAEPEAPKHRKFEKL